MGAHKKYRDIMNELKDLGVDCFIIRQSRKRYLAIAGSMHKSYRYRISANKFITRIHMQEVKTPKLFK